MVMAGSVFSSLPFSSLAPLAYGLETSVMSKKCTLNKGNARSKHLKPYKMHQTNISKLKTAKGVQIIHLNMQFPKKCCNYPKMMHKFNTY